MIDVCLLGTGGTMPLPERALTALALRCNGSTFLVDCGEGTQVQLRKKGISMHDIDVIFITHFHADHIVGLPGLLLSMAKCDRTAPVNIIAPKGASFVVRSLCVTAPGLPFDVVVTELHEDRESFVFNSINVTAQQADHSTLCYAYSFELRRAGKFDPVRARELGIDVKLWKNLQRGENVISGGQTFAPDMVLGKPRKGLKITYCTDTRPTEALASLADKSDILICEGMYAENDKLKMAIDKKHMLFGEAAEIAVSSHSSQLWLTHFSPSLRDPYQYEAQVRALFQNTVIPHDLESVTLGFGNSDCAKI